MKRFFKWSVYVGLALLVLAQLVPYGRDHSAPATNVEPTWDSLRTRELAVLACFDCHSNQTHWPWYSWVAPISWLVAHDVEEGRAHLNFSEFDRRQRNADEAADAVRSDEMPLQPYLWLHSEARLSEAEYEELASGLERTLESK